MSDEYTMKEMMQIQITRLEALHQKIDRIEVQTTKTNGRVTRLEEETRDQRKAIESLKVKALIATGILAGLLFILENIEFVKRFI